MATRDDIFQAIRNADAAGDTAAVQKLGAYLQTMPATPSAAAQVNNDAISQGARNFAADGDGSTLDAVKKGAGNAVAGLVRGAGSIGATLLAPVDMASDALDGKGLSLDANRQRRADMDATLKDFGADPNSALYKTGKITGEVAGTAGAGGLVANGARALGASAPVVDAIASGGLSGGGNAITRAAGGAVNGATTAALVDPSEATKGAVIGAVIPGVVRAAGSAGQIVSNKLADVADGASKRLMQSAIKPTLAQRASGDAGTAVDTLLKYGISPTKEGVNKIKELIDNLNGQITDRIENSTATVSRDKVLSALDDARSRFTNQVDPSADLNAIQGVADRFSEHPAFQWYGPAEEDAKSALSKATSEKVTALQAAGKLKTFAAQQNSLAQGRDIPLSLNQPEMQPYYNTGTLGRVAQSPSSLPVSGLPRFPARYTNNIDRVPEGEAGAAEAMDIFNAKRAEEASAAQALAKLQEQGATMPVQQAQQMKQGTYQVLAKKYGEVGSAETEAQKALARGLKDEVATAVPGVGELNAEESRLITTLNVSERRALLEMNKNPVGLTALAHNPIAAAGFLADRSAAFKAIAARMINNAAPVAGTVGNKLIGAASNPLLRATGIQATEASP